MKVKKLSAYIIVLIALSSVLNAQSLRIERTDVDTTRDDFITATYMFGIDIYFDDVTNCTGAAFEIIYDHAEYIKYSEYGIYDFGANTNPVVIHSVDIDGRGRLNIGVGSGFPTDSGGFDNPRIIRLEFVVMQYAPRDIEVTFTFPEPKAIRFEEGTGEIVNLSAEDEVFRIHSFIDVWPGDADNNGIVNNNDLGFVQKYIGLGSNTKNMRSFKRQNASTVWTRQRVLAWDNFEASYADCDGNGDITNNDMLVISYNWNRDTTMQMVNIKQYDHDKVQKMEKRKLLPSEIMIPVKINSYREFIALSGIIELPEFDDDYEFVEMFRGEIFNDYAFMNFNYDENNRIIHFASGNTYDRSLPEQSGTAAYIVLRKKSTFAELPIISNIEFNAISQSGRIFSIDNVTSVEENMTIKSSPVELTINKSRVSVNSENPMQRIYITDYKGVPAFSKYLNNNTNAEIDLYYLPQGVYFASIETLKGTHNLKFQIVK